MKGFVEGIETAAALAGGFGLAALAPEWLTFVGAAGVIAVGLVAVLLPTRQEAAGGGGPW